MRGVGRVYTLVSSLGFGAALAGGVFLLAAWWIVPDWLDDRRSELLAWIGGRSSSSDAARTGALPEPQTGGDASPGTLADPASAAAWDPDPSRHGAPWTLQVPPSGATSEPAAWTEAGYWGGIGAIEESVKQIESDLARYRDGAPREGDLLQGTLQSPDLVERLRAWERLREPLFALLDAARSETDPPLSSAGGSDIRRLGGVLSLRIRSLTTRIQRDSRELLGEVEPRTVFHFLLFDGDAIDDSEALTLLSSLERADALDVLDRLAGIEPTRARRLLFALAGTSWKEERAVAGEASRDAERRPEVRERVETSRSPSLRG